MNSLQLAPATTGGVDRPLLVPTLAVPNETGLTVPFQGHAMRRRLNEARIRTVDQGLRPFRVG
jgi:hypothetical protein